MPTAPPSSLAAFDATLFTLKGQLARSYEHAFRYVYELVSQEADQWRRIAIRCENLNSIDTADDAYFTLDVVNYTGGTVDNSWDDGDYNAVANQLDIFLTMWAAHMFSGYRFTELHFYVMQFNPDYNPPSNNKPYLDSGAPAKSYTLAHTGLANQPLTSQAAMTVTELVPTRRHWGRFYLPEPSSATLSGAQLFAGAIVDEVANAAHTLYANLSGVELFPVVVQNMASKVADQALLQVTGIQVDDVPDVIRRRRLKHGVHTNRQPVAASAKSPSSA